MRSSDEIRKLVHKYELFSLSNGGQVGYIYIFCGRKQFKLRTVTMPTEHMNLTLDVWSDIISKYFCIPQEHRRLGCAIHIKRSRNQYTEKLDRLIRWKDTEGALPLPNPVKGCVLGAAQHYAEGLVTAFPREDIHFVWPLERFWALSTYDTISRRICRENLVVTFQSTSVDAISIWTWVMCANESALSVIVHKVFLREMRVKCTLMTHLHSYGTLPYLRHVKHQVMKAWVFLGLSPTFVTGAHSCCLKNRISVDAITWMRQVWNGDISCEDVITRVSKEYQARISECTERRFFMYQLHHTLSNDILKSMFQSHHDKSAGVHFYDTMYKHNGFGLCISLDTISHSNITVGIFDTYWSDQNGGAFVTTLSSTCKQIQFFEELSIQNMTTGVINCVSSNKSILMTPKCNHIDFVNLVIYFASMCWSKQVYTRSNLCILLPDTIKYEAMGYFSHQKAHAIMDVRSICTLDLPHQLEWFNIMLPCRSTFDPTQEAVVIQRIGLIEQNIIVYSSNEWYEYGGFLKCLAKQVCKLCTNAFTVCDMIDALPSLSDCRIVGEQLDQYAQYKHSHWDECISIQGDSLSLKRCAQFAGFHETVIPQLMPIIHNILYTNPKIRIGSVFQYTLQIEYTGNVIIIQSNEWRVRIEFHHVSYQTKVDILFKEETCTECIDVYFERLRSVSTMWGLQEILTLTRTCTRASFDDAFALATNNAQLKLISRTRGSIVDFFI